MYVCTQNWCHLWKMASDVCVCVCVCVCVSERDHVTERSMYFSTQPISVMRLMFSRMPAQMSACAHIRHVSIHQVPLITVCTRKPRYHCIQNTLHGIHTANNLAI